jgi:hypothetical protein
LGQLGKFSFNYDKLISEYSELFIIVWTIIFLKF